MNRINMYLEELENESKTTRKMLERVPADQFDWQPHEKSMKLKALATHIAELPTWITMAIKTDGLDFAASPYTPVNVHTNQDLMELFEKSLEDGKSELIAENEILLDKPWTLSNGEQIYSTDPKSGVIRMALSQIIHHRAQLGVYLRLLNIPIPASYGPSADDPSF